MVYSFRGMIPVVHPSAFVHPQATVIGHVTIGAEVYIGPGAVLRGDWGEIIIEDGCNVQENCTVHMFPGTQVILSEGAHVGHGAIIHGATLGENCMIGMNAVIMDDAVIGAGSIIGALAFVKAETQIPERVIAVGNPAKVIREVSDEMLDWKSKGTRLYQSLPKQMHNDLQECEPLREVPEHRPLPDVDYETWKKTDS